MPWKSDSEVYECIGHFSVDFEHVCRSMETCIRNILYQEGLKNEAVQEILLAGMTADPLLTLLQRLVGEILVGTPEEKAISSRLFKELRDLIETRNELIHAKWFLVGMNVKQEETEIKALGEKLHANKEGTATKNLNLKKEEIEELIGKCREASIRISLLTRCVIGIRSLTDCFEFTDNQFIVNYKALEPIVIK
jgi:hypothetical protein